VDYNSARRTFDKLIAEKVAKGYTRGSEGTPYAGTPHDERATGVLPQLLNPLDERLVGLYVRDADWWAQEKFDGKRVLIRRNGDEVTGINRRGLTIALPTPIMEHARRLAGFQCLLDGEAVGDALIAFDLLEHDGRDLRGEPYSVRLNTLYWLQPPSHHTHITNRATPEPGIRSAATAYGSQAKAALVEGLRHARREGVVFKRRDAAYTPGRPASGGLALKYKFTATASCIVGRPDSTKRSVPLVLFDGAEAVGVGNVTIPPNQDIPKTGDIVEVRYLYAYPGGSLFQPVYLGKRDDVDAEACTVGQLKFKTSSQGDDEGV